MSHAAGPRQAGPRGCPAALTPRSRELPHPPPQPASRWRMHPPRDYPGHRRDQPRIPCVNGCGDRFFPFEQVLQLFAGRWVEGDRRVGGVHDLTRPVERARRRQAGQCPDKLSKSEHLAVSEVLGRSRRGSAGLGRGPAVPRVKVVPQSTTDRQVLHDECVLYGQQEPKVVQDRVGRGDGAGGKGHGSLPTAGPDRAAEDRGDDDGGACGHGARSWARMPRNQSWQPLY